MCHQFSEFQNCYSSYNKIGTKDAKLMDGARLKNIFVNVSEKILVAFWHMCYNVTQIKRRLSKHCTRLEARMHTHGEVSHVLFSKLMLNQQIPALMFVEPIDNILIYA